MHSSCSKLLPASMDGEYSRWVPFKSGLFNFNLKKERRTFDKCKAVVCCDGFQRMLCWIVVKTEVAKHWREFFTKTNCTQVWTLWQWKHNDDSLLVSQKQQRKERDVVRTAWKWRQHKLLRCRNKEGYFGDCIKERKEREWTNDVVVTVPVYFNWKERFNSTQTSSYAAATIVHPLAYNLLVAFISTFFWNL